MSEQPDLTAYKYKFFTVGALGTFMATFDGSILNVALPTIADQFNAPVDTAAWVVLSYSLTLIALMLVFGAWTESRGYAFAYRFGYWFFLAGSVLCALSTSIFALVFGRVVQAVGTAMFASVGPGMVTTVFPPRERGKGIGLMVMMVALGFMVGPPVGGLLLAFFDWPAIFWMNIPIAMTGLYLVGRYFALLPKRNSARPVRFLGAAALSIGLASAVFGLTQFNDHPLGDFRVWGSLLLGVTGLALFIRTESNPNRALIGLGIFRNRQFTLSVLAQSTHFVASSGVFVLIPFYLERVKGYEPKQVGLFLVILPIMMFALSPLAGKLSDRIGYRLLTGAGMVLLSAGMLALSRLDIATSDAYLVFSLILIGFGIGVFSSPNSAALMGSVTESQRAVTSGILATNRNIAMSVGIALSTALFTWLERRNVAISDPRALFVASYRPVIYLAAAIALFGLVFTVMRGNPAGQKTG